MAVDKLVDSAQLDADLTAVADAIRTKGGTSTALAFPSGFVNAIDAIETGGGSSSYSDMVNAFAKKEISGDIVLDSSVTGFPHQYFMQEQPITSFRGDGIVRLENYSFARCTALTSIHFPSLTVLYAAQCFIGCSALTMACFPKLGTGSTKYFYSSTFMNCSSLQIADLGVLGETSRGLNSQEFKGCSNLKTLILRKSDGICPLGNINCFQSSAFDSTGTGGTLYVPQAQIANYQAATNWSTILGYANNQILPIEGSIYETQYADGTPIT